MGMQCALCILFSMNSQRDWRITCKVVWLVWLAAYTACTFFATTSYYLNKLRWTYGKTFRCRNNKQRQQQQQQYEQCDREVGAENCKTYYTA